MSTAAQDPEIPTLDALLALDDAAFLSAAYRWLLGRNIDPAGFRDYDARLRAGTPRLQVVAELRGSPEGRAHGASFPGLAEALAGFRPPQRGAAASSLRDLMRLQDEAFVDTAVHMVMGLPPREEERLRLVERLRAGTPKMVLIGELLARAGQAPVQPIEGLAVVEAAMQSGLVPVAVDIDDLLSFHDLDFVDCAYKTLIGRSPDPVGLSHYTRLLRAGHSKLAIAARLARSAEGRQRSLALPGMTRAVRRYLLGRVPVLGWLLRALWHSDGESAQERRLRALDNKLERLLRDAARARVDADAARVSVDRLLQGGAGADS